MNVLNSRMVSSEMVELLVHGSYEDTIRKICDSLDKADYSKIFVGEEIKGCDPISTYKGYVVVLAENGSFWRIPYVDEKKQLTFKSAEKLNIPVIDESNYGKFVDKEIGRVVDLFLDGKADMAWGRLREVASLFTEEEKEEKICDSTCLEAVFDAVNTCEWKKAFTSESAKKFLGKTEEAPSIVKFEYLYDGSTSEDDAEKKLDDVKKATKELLSKVEWMFPRSQEAFLDYQSKRNESNSEGEEIIPQAEEMIDDYLGWVEGIINIIKEVLDDESCVMCIAKIHDRLAGAYDDIVMGSKFVDFFVKEMQNG